MCSYTEDLTGLPTERLEDEIVELAAHICAGTCRWLLLVSEFDRWRGPAGLGLPVVRRMARLALQHRA